MRGLRPYVLLISAFIAGALALASPAQANITININPGNLNTTAAAFGTHNCDAKFGGGPYVGSDVWVFNLPDQGDVFVSVTATFSTPGGDVIKTTTPADIWTGSGTSKAWIITDAGWTLKAASAEVTGSPNFFVLTHTCPASASGTPTPSVSPSNSTSGTPTPESSQSTDPSTSVSASQPPLPRTGDALGPVVLTGLIVAMAGAGLVFFLRRRRFVDEG